MAHRKRQDDAAIFQRHLLAAADIVITVPDVQIGVTDATIGNLQEYLAALGFGGRQVDFLQGLPAFDDGPGAHVCLLRCVRRMDSASRGLSKASARSDVAL